MQRTEMRNPNTTHIDKMSTFDMVKTMNNENKTVTDAVDKALDKIAQAVDAAANALENGGRIIYIGAGTSGRLGVIDASECPPTFGVEPDVVVGIIAGGLQAMTRAAESVEDNEAEGIKSVEEIGINKNDILVGISAAGNAAYVIGAIEKAKSVGAVTVGLVCNEGCKIEAAADIAIVVDTGPEVITGSTRLKAGTSQKLVLNMISTGAMIRTGKVYENLMINVRPVNKKLHKRCVGIIREITGVDEARAYEELEKADNSIRKAIENIKGELK